MKRLMLMRHGEAQDPEMDQPDNRRVLTRKGMSDMRHLYRKLLAEGLLPQFALASNARRTEMTIREVTGGLDYDGALDFSEELYNADEGTIIQKAVTLDDQYQSALIVAHSPGIYRAVIALVGDSYYPELEKKIGTNFKSGTLTVLECPIEKWSDLKQGANKLAKLFIPD